MSTDSSTDPYRNRVAKGAAPPEMPGVKFSEEKLEKETVAFDSTHHPEVGKQFKAALSPEAGSRAEF